MTLTEYESREYLQLGQYTRYMNYMAEPCHGT